MYLTSETLIVLALGLCSATPFRRAFDPATWTAPTGPECINQSPFDSKERAPDKSPLLPLPTPAKCGQSKFFNQRDLEEEKRIVGGDQSREGGYPWVVALGQGSPKDGSWSAMCGASILNGEWILTAAHCFLIDDGKGGYLPEKDMYANPCKFAIHSGQNRLLQQSDDLQVIGLKQIILHPEFSVKSVANDIALLKLDRTLDLSHADANTLCLPTSVTEQYDRSTCTIAGWGDKADGAQEGSENMRHVVLPHLGQEKCREALGDDNMTPTTICAGHLEGGKDSCQGDSGGPLFCKRTSDSSWLQLGIASWGFGCAKAGSPGVYTDVRQYLPWIQDILTRYSGATTVIPFNDSTQPQGGNNGSQDGSDSGSNGSSDGGDSGNNESSDGSDSGSNGSSDGGNSSNNESSNGGNSSNNESSDGGDSGSNGSSNGSDSGSNGSSDGGESGDYGSGFEW